MWYLYILRLDDGSLYTGITKNVERRVEQHRNGDGSKYVRGKLPLELVYTEKHEIRSEALKREHKIKSLQKPQKEELVSESKL